MKKKIIFLLIISTTLCSSIWSQVGEEVIGIDDSYSDKELIEDIFLKGFCNNVSNIQTTGEDFSIGNFFDGQRIMGIDRGIIISTGHIDSASGPNLSGETSGVIGTINDPDLSLIATSTVFDASGISFDFIPLSDRVSFTYVFASEEYCEYVNTPYNDVFGFFVSGPGIDGNFTNNGVNVALVPGTQEFVSINTINHSKNNEYYYKNEPETDALDCQIAFEPKNPGNISFDGFTLPLQAEFDVIPCETYTIRLVISDVRDPVFDSAVFLKMNSFDIGGDIRVTALSEVGQDTIISEGCTNGIFRFERSNNDISKRQTFDLEVTANSTAKLGEDIEDLELSVTFEQGETIVELPVKVLADNKVEDLEIFGLNIVGQCPCKNGGSAYLTISDPNSLEANLDGFFACIDEEFSIAPMVIGGAPPYTYQWDDGSTSDTIRTTVTGPTPIQVIVSDFCSRSVTASSTIETQATPVASIGGNYSICQGVDVSIPVDLGGTGPWDLSYQINNEPIVEVSKIQEQPYEILATASGDLKLLSFNDRTCSGSLDGIATIANDDIEIMKFMTPATCANTFDGSLSFDVISNNMVQEIKWLPENIEGYGGTGLLAGNYQLIITDEKGCILEETFELSSEPNTIGCGELNIYIPNIYSPNNDRDEDEFLIQIAHEPSIVNIASFSIFDRWGSKIFERKNFPKEEINLDFTAELNDQPIMPTVVFYIAKFNMANRETRSVSGNITVLR